MVFDIECSSWHFLNHFIFSGGLVFCVNIFVSGYIHVAFLCFYKCLVRIVLELYLIRD